MAHAFYSNRSLPLLPFKGPKKLKHLWENEMKSPMKMLFEKVLAINLMHWVIWSSSLFLGVCKLKKKNLDNMFKNHDIYCYIIYTHQKSETKILGNARNKRTDIIIDNNKINADHGLNLNR